MISFHRCFISLLIISMLLFYGDLTSAETSSSKSKKTSTGNQKNNTAENAKGKTSIPNFKQGEFTLQTNIPGNKEVKVSYIIPMGKNGKPLPSASNIVFYAPYIFENNFFNNPLFRCYPEKMGFTVFSLDIKSSMEDVSDRKKYYCYKECGFLDFVFKVQDKIAEDFKLAPRKLLITGASAGGSMAQQMGIYFPEKIDAIAICGGRLFDSPKEKSGIDWLLVNTFGCIGLEPTKQFEKEAKVLGMNVLRCETPPKWDFKTKPDFHHYPSELAFQLLQTYLRDIVRLRERNGGIIPPPGKWPASETVNNEKIYFPSAEFAALWKKLPYRESLQLDDEKRDKGKPIVLLPANGNPEKIIIFVHDPVFYDSTLILDNLCFLSEKSKAIAIGVEVSDDYFVTARNIGTIIDKALKYPQWSKLPLYVAGSGYGGMVAAAAALKNGNKRIKKITTFNSSYESPFPELSIADARGKNCAIPLKMIYDNKDSEAGDKDAGVEVSYDIPQNDGDISFFGGQWFALLDEAAK